MECRSSGLWYLPFQAQAVCLLVHWDPWRSSCILGSQGTLPCFLLDSGLYLLWPGTIISPSSFKSLPSAVFVSTTRKITNHKCNTSELYKGTMAGMMGSLPETTIRSCTSGKERRTGIVIKGRENLEGICGVQAKRTVSQRNGDQRGKLVCGNTMKRPQLWSPCQCKDRISWGHATQKHHFVIMPVAHQITRNVEFELHV